MRLLITAVITIGLAQAVAANPCFYNPTQNTIAVRVTLPNGEKVEEKISPGISNLGNRSASVPTQAKQMDAEVVDDLGTSLWKGKVLNDTCYVIFPGADGKTAVLASGHYSGDNSLKAAYIANLTGENFTVEFVGGYGVDAQKGLSYGPSYDKAKVFRFNAKEDNYKVRLVDAQGSRTELGNTLSTGRYHVIFKNGEGKYAIDSMGYIK